MIRKLQIALHPTDVIETLLELSEAEDWPRGCEDLQELVAERVEALAEVFDGVLAQLLDLDERAAGVEIADDGLSLEVYIDMHDLLTAGRGRQHAQELLRIIDEIKAALAFGFELDVYLGGRCSTIEAGEAALRERVRSRGGHRGEERQSRTRKRASSSSQASGSYGGLDDDAYADDVDGDHADGDDVDGDDRAWTSDASRPQGPAVDFFFAYSQSPWPCSADELKRTYWQGARQLHPDVNGEDPAAESRFRLFKDGYERCRAWIEAESRCEQAAQA